MTFNNSVLLIVKQFPGIDFNDLLTKVSSRYKSPASARSALARAIKDLTSFGLLKKDNSKLFITDKGLASISIEMKDKLVIRLNEEMRRPLTNLDDIVRLLIILHQRGSADKDLLNNARENASFTISDIEELRRKIRAQRKHLKKMSALLQTQAEKLKELDFNDSRLFTFDEAFAVKLGVYCKGQKIVIETKDKLVLEKIPEHWKKQGIISVDGEAVPLFLQLLASIPSAKATLYLSGFKIILMAGKANCFGPHKNIKNFIDSSLASSIQSEQKSILAVK